MREQKKALKKHAIIFDLGAVMVDWNPQAIAEKFTPDIALQQLIYKNLFHHQNWIQFDNGLISEQDLISKSSDTLNLSATRVSELMQQAKESLSAHQNMVNLLALAHKKGLKTVCLSNLSHEWFAYLNQRHEFFQFFDGIVISAQEQIGKPNPDIYQRLIKRYELDVKNTLFVDDREDNTQAAIKLGIKSITFTHSEKNLNDIADFILRDISITLNKPPVPANNP